MPCKSFPLLFLVVLTLALPSAFARRLYPFQDDAGNWQYSDIPPAAPALIFTAQPKKFALRRKGPENEPDYWAINDYRGPVALDVSVAEGKNFKAFPELPKTILVPGGAEIRAFTLRPADPSAPWNYKLKYNVALGDPKAQHKPPKPYGIPFAAGSFPVTQGFHGAASHNHPASEFAVDIAMPEGTDIVAARAGTVMDVANDFFGGGLDEKYQETANLIRILHDDGTMAVYGHLRLESARIAVGMKVKEGQVIGKSGNTGFSGGPHLHFVVQKNTDMQLVAVPFEFAGPDGKGFEPKQGTTLTAPP
ncbi:MAG: M23 family metallopeptidase [Gammaproteobacteria bacterium]